MVYNICIGDKKMEKTNNIIQQMQKKGYTLVEQTTHKKGNKECLKFECLLPVDTTIRDVHEKAEKDTEFFKTIGVKRRGMKYTKDGALLKASYHYTKGDER